MVAGVFFYCLQLMAGISRAEVLAVTPEVACVFSVVVRGSPIKFCFCALFQGSIVFSLDIIFVFL